MALSTLLYSVGAGLLSVLLAEVAVAGLCWSRGTLPWRWAAAGVLAGFLAAEVFTLWLFAQWDGIERM